MLSYLGPEASEGHQLARPSRHNHMVQYDFTRLGAVGFEKLCQALAKPVLGLQVRLTDDAGRDYWDAEFDGTLDSSEVAHAGKLSGPAVFIVKYVPVSGRPRGDFRALESTLKLDLDRLHKLQLSGTSNDRFPRYIIYAINIPLTKNIDGGSMRSIPLSRAMLTYYHWRVGLSGMPIKSPPILINFQMFDLALSLHKTIYHSYGRPVTLRASQYFG